MFGQDGAPPAGYAEFTVGTAQAVGMGALVAPLVDALREGSFYAYAAHHPEARPLAGRGIAYAVPLPGAVARVVVRRSRHGGALAPMTGERFLGNTRAPRELLTSLRLNRLGIPTPELIAYATYPAGGLFRKADVVTRELEGGRDLASALTDAEGDGDRRVMLAATAQLLGRLTVCGVRHPDLNLRNILICSTDSGVDAYLLDVDRVWFDDPGADRVTDANLRRFLRSARKLERLHGLPLERSDLLRLTFEVNVAIDQLTV